MIKRIYTIFSFVILFLILGTVFLMIALSRPQTLEYFGDKYLKTNGLEYSDISGSIFSHIILKNVRFKEAVSAKYLKVSYHLPLLLLPTPKISHIIIENASILPLKFRTKDKNSTASILPFSISKIEFKNSNIIFNQRNIAFDTNISNLNYNKEVEIKKISAQLIMSDYGKILVNGSLKKELLRGNARLYPVSKKLPSKLSFDFLANKESIAIHFYINKLTYKDDKNLTIKNANINLNYPFKSDNITFKAKYKINYDQYICDVNQSGFFTTKGDFTSLLKAETTRKSAKLPFEEIYIASKGNSKKISLHVKAGSYKFDINGTDYKKFRILGDAKDIKLGVLKKANLKTESILAVSPLSLSGKFWINDIDKKLSADFSINKKTVRLHSNVSLKKQKLSFDVNATDYSYDKKLEIKKLSLILSLPQYGKTNVRGSIKSDILEGKAKYFPNVKISKQYLSFLKNPVLPIEYYVKANKKDISIRSYIDKLKFKDDENLTIENTNINLTYPFKSDSITFKTNYKINYDKYVLDTNQSGFVTIKGNFTSHLNAKIKQHPVNLPFQEINISSHGNSKKISLHVEAGLYKFDIDGKDYKKYDIRGNAKGVTLGFLNNFPDVFKKDKLDINTTATLGTSPFLLSGNINVKSIAGQLRGRYKMDKKSILLSPIFTPNVKYKLWKDYPVKKISPAKITIYQDAGSKVLNIDAKILNATLFKKQNKLGGWGNIATAFYDLKGEVSKKSGTILNISAKLASLKNFLLDIGVKNFTKDSYIDAAIDINSTLNISKDIRFRSDITLPWYKLAIDKDTKYEGENLFIKSTLKNQQVLISSYGFDILNHHIYSNRTSKISYKKDGEIDFKEFWVFDNLLLKGIINPLKKEGYLHLMSKKFRYEGKEGNVTASADLMASLETNGSQDFTGHITLLDGTVSLEPSKNFSVSDDDIIIIQNIKENRAIKRSVNIQISSKKQIRYKTKDVDLWFIPDFTLFQEKGDALEYLGMVTIQEGKVEKSGKKFELAKSEVYLQGAHPLNPYLNINLIYKTNDDIKIKVFITNTLASPLVLLASNPSMDQNDIMSYMLFGKPASSAFQNSKNGETSISLGTILFGTGLKKMFQDTTHVNIDTLNILNSKNKKLGYEIGASLNDKIRIVYKNDTISSIIVQYSLSKSIRIDVDVRESAEGVRVLYTKDF